MAKENFRLLNQGAQIELEYLILADRADNWQGRVYIHGGGLKSLGATSFPVTHPFISVAGGISIEQSNIKVALLSLDILGPDGKSILPEPARSSVASNDSRFMEGITIVFNFSMITFQQAGQYQFVLSLAGVELGRRKLTLILNTSA